MKQLHRKPAVAAMLAIILGSVFSPGCGKPAITAPPGAADPLTAPADRQIEVLMEEPPAFEKAVIAEYIRQLQSENSDAAAQPAAQNPASTEMLSIETLPAQAPAGTDSPAASILRMSDPEMADQLISLNFDEVDIRTMIRTIGDITGTNFVLDDSVAGKVTVISPAKIRMADIDMVLSSILEIKGYAAVPGNGLVKIVPRARALSNNHAVGVGLDPHSIPDHDSIVTQLIPLQHAVAADVSTIIRPLLPRDAQLSACTRTNTILITTSASSIRHLASIIQNLDVSGQQKLTRVISLEYASAATLAKQLTEIMEAGSARKTPPPVEGEARILPDARTNSLLVIADNEKMRQIVALIGQLDIKQPALAGNVNVIYLENATADKLAASLKEALAGLRSAGAIAEDSQIQISADEGTNALIIAASSQDFKIINDIVQKLDIHRDMVLVEMMIMEISEDSLREIGIDWATLDRAVSDSVRGFSTTNFGIGSNFRQGELEGLAVGAWKEVGDNVSIGAILHALDRKSGVNILSTPHILTSNHNTARIVVGENRPFVVSSRITEEDPATPTVVRTFEYKDVGITLEITPHISRQGNVRLKVFSEFTKLIEDVTLGSVGTPITAKRQAETIISMQSGKTIVIGGLIRDDKVTVTKGVPLLSQIPLLGNLFRYQRDRIEKTNLLIFITPTVLNSIEEMQQMTARKKGEVEAAARHISPTAAAQLKD